MFINKQLKQTQRSLQSEKKKKITYQINVLVLNILQRTTSRHVSLSLRQIKNTKIVKIIDKKSSKKSNDDEVIIFEIFFVF